MELFPATRYETRQTLLRRIQSHGEQGCLKFYQKCSPLIHCLCQLKKTVDEDLVPLVIESVMIRFVILNRSFDWSLGKFRNLMKTHQINGALPAARNPSHFKTLATSTTLVYTL
jgi:hypothetical protein